MEKHRHTTPQSFGPEVKLEEGLDAQTSQEQPSRQSGGPLHEPSQELVEQEKAEE
ncbi:hypothetical protein NHQ30_003217 [Ciborinia camelliae]|nr:hypothetical protein NHQ30_003217 [Ciborinia camelliae]